MANLAKSETLVNIDFSTMFFKCLFWRQQKPRNYAVFLLTSPNYYEQTYIPLKRGEKSESIQYKNLNLAGI